MRQEAEQAIRGSRAALAGIVFAALYVASFLAVRGLPRPEWSDERILHFYAGRGLGYAKLVALYLVPFAGIAFLWFLAAFRHQVLRLAGTENTLLSTVQLLSGAVYVAMQFSAAASIATVILTLDSVGATPASITNVRPFLTLGDTILVVYALRAAAVFMMAGTTRALRAGLFRRWFAILSYALALLLVLTISHARFVSLLFPLWIGVTSVLILLRRQRLLARLEA